MGLRTWTQPVCRVLICSQGFQPSWWEIRTDIIFPWPRIRPTCGQSRGSTGPAVSTGRPHCSSLPAQIPTPSLRLLGGHGGGETLCAGLCPTNPKLRDGWCFTRSRFSVPHCPQCLAQRPHIGLDQYLTDGLASHQGSPEPPPGSFLGTPTPSWEWSSARRASLPLKPTAPSCPAPSQQPVQGLYYLVCVWGARNIIHASALGVT